MSTSTVQRQSNAPTIQKKPAWQRRQLSPVRGLLFLAIMAGLIIATAMNYEAVWDILADFVPAAFKFAEEMFEGGLQLVGMAPGPAQIVTIYLGIVVLLVLFYILLRKSMAWIRSARDTIRDYREMYTHLLRTGTSDLQARALDWWHDLDWMQKIAAVVGVILIAIPVFVALSIGLGMMVAMAL